MEEGLRNGAGAPCGRRDPQSCSKRPRRFSKRSISVSRVTFDYSSVIAGKGGIGMAVAIAGSLAGGFLTGCIVNLFIDMPKYLRAKKKAAAQKQDAA